jgi:flagellar protein FliS
MQASACENYLATDVMTATPQKLQLMLIEAAIRSAERARDRWQAGEHGQADAALIHAQQIVGELLAGLNREADADLVKKVASVYLFVFRTLMEANHERDETKLNDALRVLEVERETWRRVCEQWGSRQTPALPSGAHLNAVPNGRAPALKPSGQPAELPPDAARTPSPTDVSPGPDAPGDSTASRLSLEA